MCQTDWQILYALIVRVCRVILKYCIVGYSFTCPFRMILTQFYDTCRLKSSSSDTANKSSNKNKDPDASDQSDNDDEDNDTAENNNKKASQDKVP